MSAPPTPAALALVAPATVEHPWLALAGIATLAAASWAIGRRSWADGSAGRHAVALACRCALLSLLVLALSGLQWQRERSDVAVAFAVDSSDSVRGSRERAATLIREAAALARPGDRAAIVQFGRDALVERSLSEELADVSLSSAPEPDGSDLAGALRLARGVLPPDGRRRVVVMTDGDVSGDDPAAALRALREDGVDVVLVPLSDRDGPEVLVDEISSPERVHEGEPFEVRVVLRASAETRGTLTITRDGRVIGQAEVDVGPGPPSAFRFVDRLEDAGVRLYRAHFDAEQDGFEQNDAAETLVRVEGQPSMLLLDPEPARLEPLVALLRSAGIDAVAGGPERVPRSVAEAGRYAAIALSNVDSVNLTERQMRALHSFVRETGGGLLMAGGPDSFGPGGWYETPVEEALPVDMDVRNEKYYPSLTMVLAIDKSGSMSGTDGASKMDLAKEAASQTAALLQRNDRLGVIAFDSAAMLVVDPAVTTRPEDAAARVGTIRAGGGTDIYPALVVAEEKLAASPTALKHLIVLSDGQSPPRDFATILGRMRQAKVTTSSVAVGADADLATMQMIAQVGGGRFYFTDDPSSIPRIFTKEAFTTARSFVVEEDVVPEPQGAHAVLRGALPLPRVTGYVATTAKPSAEVALMTPRGDPLLALRSFGLGRTAALTTDLGQRWSTAWLQAPAGRTLLTQLARTLASRSDSPLLEASLERRGGRVIVSVEARDERGGFLNFADLRAGVVGPDHARQDVTLRQVAPGRYEADVQDRGPGAWFAGIVQSAGDRVVRSTGAARVFTYSEEYRTLQAPGDAVGRLAVSSGAPIVQDAAAFFARTGPAARALRPAWRELLLAAAVLLLVDVALRRVMLPEGWAAAAAGWVRARLPRRPRAVAASTAGLSRLREVKAEARASAEAPAPRAGRPAGAAESASASVPAAAPPLPISPPEPRIAPPAVTPPEETGPAQFGSRLLAAKRRAKSEK